MPQSLEGGEEIIRLGELEINLAGCQARIDGSPLSFTPTEFRLLAFLAQNRGKTFSREQLMDEVWDYGYKQGDRTVDNCISRLRMKVERHSAHPRHLLTVRGKGYRLE
jgi:two-component system alkaline phosphatase synthesis response regulator PhoP